jgi:hypothetical protein
MKAVVPSEPRDALAWDDCGHLVGPRSGPAQSCSCGGAAATFLAAAVVEKEHSKGVPLSVVPGERVV